MEELFPPVVAGGGIVFNRKKQLLMILRKGKWDLPKGKPDADESLPQTALREVMEETGATDLVIDRKAGVTRHIFFTGSKGFIKETHWFLMRSSGELPLTPQYSENILQAKWVDVMNFPVIFVKTWPSVRDILNNYFELPTAFDDPLTLVSNH
ncbi:MAG TPA: NUDIX domain-containing protein [Bacteroidales bacterium]|nr:NUDIX domain-containing protein [Bacteroidales bacterium]